MESNVPYIEIAPVQEEEEAATYDTASKGNNEIQCMSELIYSCKFGDEVFISCMNLGRIPITQKIVTFLVKMFLNSSRV